MPRRTDLDIRGIFSLSLGNGRIQASSRRTVDFMSKGDVKRLSQEKSYLDTTLSTGFATLAGLPSVHHAFAGTESSSA
jgi:hypothetical protein